MVRYQADSPFYRQWFVLILVLLIKQVKGNTIAHCLIEKVDSTNISRCIECQKGYAYAYNATQCPPPCIQPNCRACAMDTKKCLVCHIGYTLTNQKCVKKMQCQDQNCAICSQDPLICQTCVVRRPYKITTYEFKNQTNYYQYTECTLCRYPEQKVVDNICQCKNGSGLIATANGLQCQKCKLPCYNCSQKTDKCLRCIRQYYLNGTVCLPCEQQNCVCNQQGQCTKCLTGFIFANKRCLPSPKNQKYLFCMEGCYQCFSYDYCSSCLDGYALRYYHWDCFKCSDGCRRCDYYANLTCVTCFEGYRLQNGSCVKCLVFNCMDCREKADTCYQCLEGFISANSSCRPCAANCIWCGRTGEGKCDQFWCKIGYTRSKEGICVACALGCYQCRLEDISTCVICPQGTWQVAVDECQTCNSTCKECISDTKCTSCQIGFRLVDSRCIQDCIYPCIKCSVHNNSICLQCYKGYRLNESYLCVGDISCNNYKNCSSCPFNYYLQSINKCYRCTKIQKCFKCLDSDDRCETCVAGYYLYKNRCHLCNSNCTRCYLQSYCLSCISTHYLRLQDRLATYGKCLLCDKMCLTCEGESTRCKTCHKNQKLIGYTCINVQSVIFSLTMQHSTIRDGYTEKMTLIRDIVPFTIFIAQAIGEPFRKNPKFLYLKGITFGSITITFLAAFQDFSSQSSQKNIEIGLNTLQIYKDFTILSSQIVEDSNQGNVTSQMRNLYFILALIPAPIFIFLCCYMVVRYIFLKVLRVQIEKIDKWSQDKALEVNLEPLSTQKNLKTQQSGAITL